MKKIFVSILFVTSISVAHAQKYLDRFFNKYKQENAATSFAMGRPGLWLSAAFSGDKDAAGWLDKISAIRLLALDNQHISGLDDDVAVLDRKLERDHFDELLTVRDGKSNVKILAKQDAKFIRNVVLLVNDENDFVLVHLTGRFSYNDLSKIQSAFSSKQRDDHFNLTSD
jgi:Domain of unknown function (DUF4252)